MDNTVQPETKICKQCRETKPLSDFYRNRSGYHFALCKICNNERNNKLAHQRIARDQALIESGEQPDTPQFLTCRKCQQIKPIGEFRRDRFKKNGYAYLCKHCRAIGSKIDRKKPYVQRLSYTNYEYDRPVDSRVTHLQSSLFTTYKLSIADYEKMLDAQNGVCAICGQTNKSGRRLFVDHCHKTGAVRELLCMHCNFALGFLEDNPDRAEKLLAYLHKHAALAEGL